MLSTMHYNSIKWKIYKKRCLINIDLTKIFDFKILHKILLINFLENFHKIVFNKYHF
jgi:septin family protein